MDMTRPAMKHLLLVGSFLFVGFVLVKFSVKLPMDSILSSKVVQLSLLINTKYTCFEQTSAHLATKVFKYSSGDACFYWFV